MMKRVLPLTLRLLLVVLLATFLSPSFAWQTVVCHSGLAHADPSVAAEDDVHHHENGVHHQDHDDAAHGQIGHLLSHLPVVIMPHVVPILSTMAFRIAYPVRQDTFAHTDAEPPFKPPRSLPFA